MPNESPVLTPPLCMVCGGSTAPHSTKDSAQYRICVNCALIFQHPLPTREAMQAWADREYATGAYRDYVESRPMKIRHFEARLAELGDRVKPGRLLDVGCSCGYFLEVASAHGFEVRGVEFSPNAIAAASRAVRTSIVEGSVETLPEMQPFDIVSAFDIIEHVPDPRAFLRECARRLRPGGLLVISTPDTDHILRSVMGSRWPMLQPMQHLFLFSRRALADLLRAEGFIDVDVRTAYKTLRIDYLIQQIKPLNPVLSFALETLSKPVPAAVLERDRRVNIGEVLAITRKA